MRIKKFIWLAVFLLVIGAASAQTYLLESHNETSWANDAQNNYNLGMIIQIKEDLYLNNVTLANGGTSDTCRLFDTTGTVIINSVSRVGDLCDFGTTQLRLNATQKFRIVVFKSSSFTGRTDFSATWPVEGTRVTWISATYGSGATSTTNDTSAARDIQAIGTTNIGAPATPPASEPFYISAQNVYNSSYLISLNATVDGTKYGTTNGFINVTSILKNTTALHNVTVWATNYFNVSYTNLNASTNLTASVYQAIINVTAYDYYTNASQDTFTTAAGLATNTTTTGKGVLYVNAGTYVINITNSNHAFNSTTVNVAGGNSSAVNFSLFSELNVYAQNTINGAQISGFTVSLKDLDTGRTDSNTTTGNKSFFLVGAENLNLTIQAPGYAYTTVNVSTAGASTNYTFKLYTTNSYNITFKREDTQAIINTTLIFLDVISDTYSTNKSTSNGTLYIDALTPITYSFRYYGTGFNPRLSSYTLTNNTYNEITLYLLPGGQNVTLFVYNEDNNPVENAEINIYRYSTVSNSYVLITTINTDFEGKAVVNLQTNAEFYRFYIYYGGDLKLSTTPAYISSTELIFTINTGGEFLENYFTTATDYTYSLTYIPTSANFRFYYDTNGEASTGCVVLYTYVVGTGEVYHSQNCASSPTSTLLLTSPNDTDTTYIAYGIITVSGTNKTLAVNQWRLSSSGLNSTFGLFLGVLILGVFAFLGSYNLKAALILLPIGLIITTEIGLINLPTPAAVAIIVIGVILAFSIERTG